MQNNIQFNFSGYHLEKINLTRDVNSVPKELSLKVKDIMSQEDNTFISMWIVTKIHFNDGNHGEFVYRSLFQVENVEFIKQEDDFDFSFLDDTQKDIALKMIMTVFPFIRQSLDATTNDSSFNIKLPVIDSRDILSGVTLNYVNSEESEENIQE